MSANASAIKKHAREWLRHADEDLRLARHAFKLKSAVPYKLIAYHAQQCAEKCLKAYLVYKKIDFPYTHNISLLLEILPPSAGWSKDIWNAGILSPYAVTAPYPASSPWSHSARFSRWCPQWTSLRKRWIHALKR